MNTFCYLYLAGPGRDIAELRKILAGEVLGAWRQAGITPWGVWAGLFGIASNELLVVAAASGQRTEAEFTSMMPEAVQVIEALPIVPTVRPVDPAPCEKPGLYVFRFFDVKNADVDEIAGLSLEAWTTFEKSDDYQAEPQGLFRQADVGPERGRMLLVTWYDGLESWQTSRRPAPEAVENFQRRRDLTYGTSALATRLVESLVE